MGTFELVSASWQMVDNLYWGAVEDVDFLIRVSTDGVSKCVM